MRAERLKINNFIPNYPSPSDPEFYKKIFQKKEFYQQKLDTTEMRPESMVFPDNLYKHQKFISNFMSSQTPYNKILLFHEMGCLHPDTPVLVWNGKTKLAREITLADKLVGDDGRERAILALKSGTADMYRISQDNIAAYVVNKAHVLTLFIEDALPSIIRNCSNMWTVKWFDNEELKFRTKTSGDREMIEKFVDGLKVESVIDVSVEKYVSLHSETKKKAFCFRNKTPIEWPERPLAGDAYLYGLWYRGNATAETRIPWEYLYNSIFHRKELLRGLSNPLNGVIDNTTGGLKELFFLVHSLGLSYTYELGMMLPDVAECSHTNSTMKTRLKVEFVGEGSYNGWTLSGNGRFLLGDFTVTHNSGKSCSAVAIAEQIRRENSEIDGAIYIAPRRIVKNFILELGAVCVPNEYISKTSLVTQSADANVAEIKKRAREFYKFFTFKDFYNYINTLDKREKTKRQNKLDVFSNKVIIIDEVHNMKPENKEYAAILDLCRTAVNTKIVLLTGSPMIDSPEEVVTTLNLLVDNTADLLLRDKFKEKYLDKEKLKAEEVYKITKNQVVLEEFKNLFKGKISYIAAMESDVTKNFVGKSNVGDLSYLKLATSTMSDFQKSVYEQAYRKDTIEKDTNGDKAQLDKNSAFYSHSRQASLFVFPLMQNVSEKEGDQKGYYGSEGYKHYIHEGSDGGKHYALNQPFKRQLQGKTNKETVANIQKYSCVYAAVLSEILSAKGKDRCTFVYIETVHGGGAILFSKLMELVGFSDASSFDQSIKKKKYILLTGQTSSKITTLIQRFNNSENYKGDDIQVIIGSGIVSEGVSFKHILEEHIVEPDWNYTPIAQAIARGVRAGSHDDYKTNTNQDKLTVNIYHHAALTSENILDKSELNGSIHYRKYKQSELKDISIKSVERVLKEIAVDCALASKRNMRNNVIYANNSRDCDYQNCSYECYGMKDEPMNLEPNDLDKITYQLYHSNQKKNIREIIKNIFKKHFKLSLDQLLVEVEVEVQNQDSDTFSFFEFMSTIRSIIDDNIILTNKYGFNSFLREEKNIFFLVDSLASGDNFVSNYYTRYPIVTTKMDFKQLTNNIYFDHANLFNLSKTIMNKKSQKLQENMILNLPIEVIETLLETYFFLLKIDPSKNIEFLPDTDDQVRFGKLLIEKFRDVIFKDRNDHYVSTLLLPRLNILRYIRADGSSSTWNDSPKEMLEKYKRNPKYNIKKAQEELKVLVKYDILNVDEPIFIVDYRGITDAKQFSKTSGYNCIEHNLDDLILFMVEMKISADIAFDERLNTEFTRDQEDIRRYLSSFTDVLKIEEEMKKKKNTKKILEKLSHNDTLSEDEKDRMIRHAWFWGIAVKTKGDLCKVIREWAHRENILDASEQVRLVNKDDVQQHFPTLPEKSHASAPPTTTDQPKKPRGRPRKNP